MLNYILEKLFDICYILVSLGENPQGKRQPKLEQFIYNSIAAILKQNKKKTVFFCKLVDAIFTLNINKN